MEIILVLALLIEAVITTIKWLVDSKFNWQRITAIVVAVFVTVLASVDIFAVVGIPLLLPFVGAVLTGLIIARGANAIYDLYMAFQSFGVLRKTEFPAIRAESVNIIGEKDASTLIGKT